MEEKMSTEDRGKEEVQHDEERGWEQRGTDKM